MNDRYNLLGWCLALLIVLLAALAGGCGSDGETGRMVSRVVDGPCSGLLIDSEDGGAACVQ